jgi:hypothetical protein
MEEVVLVLQPTYLILIDCVLMVTEHKEKFYLFIYFLMHLCLE